MRVEDLVDYQVSIVVAGLLIALLLLTFYEARKEAFVNKY